MEGIKNFTTLFQFTPTLYCPNQANPTKAIQIKLLVHKVVERLFLIMGGLNKWKSFKEQNKDNT